MHIKIGSRGSKLALWQSNHVGEQLQVRFPEVTYEIVVIKTKGDKIQDVSLRKIGDKGLFVKEIENQLIEGTIDMAVHSMKDMPSELPESLVFAKSMKREDPRDVLILKDASSLDELKLGAIIGTGSLRRATQMKRLRPDIVIKDIRGNVETRLQKLYDEDYDGIIMAAAGLKRVGLESVITSYFTYDEMVPASAQGALAVELREDQAELMEMMNALVEEESDICVQAERLFLGSMGGSCHIPIGGHCEKVDDGYVFRGIFGSGLDDTIAVCKREGKNPMELAMEAVEELKEK